MIGKDDARKEKMPRGQPPTYGWLGGRGERRRKMVEWVDEEKGTGEKEKARSSWRYAVRVFGWICTQWVWYLGQRGGMWVIKTHHDNCKVPKVGSQSLLARMYYVGTLCKAGHSLSPCTLIPPRRCSKTGMYRVPLSLARHARSELANKALDRSALHFFLDVLALLYQDLLSTYRGEASSYNAVSWRFYFRYHIRRLQHTALLTLSPSL